MTIRLDSPVPKKEKTSLKESLENLGDAVIAHLCFWHMGCFLWWLGGGTMIVLMRILIFDLTGSLHPNRLMTYEMFSVILLFLVFCLGAKNINKRNGDNGAQQNGNAHNSPPDRFKGEVWVMLFGVFAVLVVHDHLVPGFKFLGRFGDIKNIPYVFYLAVWAIYAVLAGSRVHDIWKMVQEGTPFFARKYP